MKTILLNVASLLIIVIPLLLLALSYFDCLYQ